MEERARQFVILDPYRPLFQDPPDNDVIILLGGRGSAKSTHASIFLNDLSYQKGHVILFTRWTMKSAEKSIIPEFTATMEKMGNRQDFSITSDEIINKVSGSRILFSGIKTSSGNQTANLKSIPGLTTFVIDEGEEFLDEDTFDTIKKSVRSKLRPNRTIWIQNPSHKKHFIYGRYVAPNAPYPCTIIRTTYLDNLENLSAEFLADAEIMKNTNYKRYAHIYLGEWLDDAEGLLWDMDILNATRTTEAPEIVRSVVAVDPAVTSNASSDETGIVVVGKDANGHGYVLEDISGRYTPNEWAQKAVEAHNRHRANAIVCEVNQGGDLVTNAIKTIDDRILVKAVRATKGKALRAEPIYALYQRGLIHHVGYFGKLESQMVSFNPDANQSSPDRLDALVWGFTDLMIVRVGGAKSANAGWVPRHDGRKM